MIDHIALAIGHGLMAIALLRLVMRAGLDDDPLIGELKSEAEEKRKANSSAGRNAARKADLDDDSDAKANDAHPGSKAAAHKSPGSSGAAAAHKSARSSSAAVAHKNPRSSSAAVAHKNA